MINVKAQFGMGGRVEPLSPDSCNGQQIRARCWEGILADRPTRPSPVRRSPRIIYHRKNDGDRQRQHKLARKKPTKCH
jgi:hypothetical protein